MPGLIKERGGLSDWGFVKTRTAADGGVWRSADGLLYKRTGTATVLAEARHLQEQYESSGTIHTDTFPTLAAFSDRLAHPRAAWINKPTDPDRQQEQQLNQ